MRTLRRITPLSRIDIVRARQDQGNSTRTLRSPEAAARFLIANITGMRVAARGGADMESRMTIGKLLLKP